MNTLLVPTDFSATAHNAALYALHFAKQVKCKKIILYNAYQTPMATDANLALLDVIDINELEKNSKENLENFRRLLIPECDESITMEVKSEYGSISTDINEICSDNNIDGIVMGVTGGGKLEETLIGSFAIDVAKHSQVPVIVVPPNAGYTPIQEIMLACDFSKVVETMPAAPIKKILDETGAKLFVVNIDHKSKHFTPDTPFETLMVDTMLHNYNPEYVFVDDTDFVEAINRIALEKQVDLIITIPKRMGWFDGLFRKNHTKMLAYHSHVPLMVVH